MLQSTFVLSLLASAVSAQQYGSNPEASVRSLSRSTPCSTSTPPAGTSSCTSIPVTALPSIAYTTGFPTTIPVDISTQIGVDQPAPSVSVYVPESLSFNPKNALAFTSSTEVPNPTIGPLSSSTPCSSGAISTLAPSWSYTAYFSTTIPAEISTQIGVDQPAPSASMYVPASESFNPKYALAFTSSTEVPNPTIGPISSSTPCSSNVAPTPAAEESANRKATSTVLPTQMSAQKPKTTLCTKTKSKATITVFPTPTAKAAAAQLSSDSADKPAHPSNSSPAGKSNNGRPGYGRGRPRHSAWHAAPKPKPSAIGAAKVSSSSCTLQTKARPTATPAAGGY